jgi:hypothetical protein
MVCEVVDWIRVNQDRVIQWQALVNIIILGFMKKA